MALGKCVDHVLDYPDAGDIYTRVFELETQKELCRLQMQEPEPTQPCKLPKKGRS